jgi:hypothetical protein
MDELDAGGVDLDVMGSPPATELVAAGGQLTNQVGKSSLRVQQGDSVVDHPVPVAEKLGRVRVEKTNLALLAGLTGSA